MSATQSQNSTSNKNAITDAKQAAALVKRRIEEPVMKDGKPVKGKDGNVEIKIVEKAIKPDEVLSFKDYGDFVVVVTTDGKKFQGAK